MDSLESSERGESNKHYLKGSIPKGNFPRDPMSRTLMAGTFFLFVLKITFYNRSW
uniref:Uncharacterized protein n=1 Tax=Glypta fumiferanae TaxID=389681 RepID=A0A0F6Q8X6_9HYME|nr:hypothetical protein [Glypta fumiferanae]